jgi:hypothetical protein
VTENLHQTYAAIFFALASIFQFRVALWWIALVPMLSALAASRPKNALDYVSVVMWRTKSA